LDCFNPPVCVGIEVVKLGMDALVCLAALWIGAAFSAKWKPQNESANARMSLRAPSPGRAGPASPAQFFESIRQSPKPPSRVPPPIVQLSDDPAADLRYVPEKEVPLWFARWLEVDSEAAIDWLAALDSIDHAAALVPVVIVKFYPEKEMPLSNPEASEDEGPPIMKDLAHFAYKYEASRFHIVPRRSRCWNRCGDSRRRH
jgi:hypothetical protein